MKIKENNGKILKTIIAIIVLIAMLALSASTYLLYLKEGLSSMVGSLTAIVGGVTLLAIILLSESTESK